MATSVAIFFGFMLVCLMLFRRLNRFSTVIVTILALLQILSPLIHAHPAGSLLSATSGVHIHSGTPIYSEAADFSVADKVHTLKAEQIEAQAIGVPSGTQPEKYLVPAITLVFLFIFILFNAQSAKYAFVRSSQLFNARSSPPYSSPSPRAPPLY